MKYLYPLIFITLLFSFCKNNNKSAVQSNSRTASNYTKQDSLYINGLLEEVIYHFDVSGNLDSSRVLLDSSSAYIKRKGLTRSLLFTDMKMLEGVYWQYRYKDRDRALEIYHELIDTAMSFMDSNAIRLGQYYGNLAYTYKSANKYEQALYYLDKSITCMRKDSIEWANSIANFKLVLADVHSELDHHETALKIIYNALETKIQLHGTESLKLVDTYGNLASILYEMDDFEKSLQYRKKAIEIIKKNGTSERKLSVAYSQLAMIYSGMKQHEKAIEYYTKGLKLNQELYDSDDERIGLSYGNLAVEYQKLGEYEKALDYHFKSLKIETAARGEVNTSNATTLNNIALTYEHMGEYEQALQYTYKAMELHKKLFDTYHEQVGLDYRDLSKYYAQLEKYEKAYAYSDSFNMVKDSILKKEKYVAVNQLKEQLDAANKDFQIELLNKDMQLQAAENERQRKNYFIAGGGVLSLLLLIGVFWYNRNKQVRQKLEKEMRDAQLTSLKSLMDHHFIFSSLNTVDSFILENKTEKASDFLVKFSRLVRSILDKSQVHTISLKEEIEICENFLNIERIRHDQNFNFKVNISKDLKTDKISFPSLLLQPVVENAIKHGVGKTDRKGFINLSIKKDSNMILCTVKDNGEGIDKQNPTSNHKSWSTMGLKKRLNAYKRYYKQSTDFKVDSTTQGTTVLIKFPLIKLENEKV